MRLSIRSISASALAIAVLLMLPIYASMAQSSGPNADPSVPEYSEAPNAVNPQLIDDATLQHTAKAFVKVSQIAKSEKRVLDSAGDDTAKMKAAQQANDGPERAFYQGLARYCDELATKFRQVIAKRTGASLAAE